MERQNFAICRTLLILGACISAAFASENTNSQENEPSPRPTVGLVLGGGGARGAAHVGVIKVLEELRIPVDYIVGTSMGAIVGGLYASGMNADGLGVIVETADWSALLTDRPPRSQRSFRRKSDDVGFLVDFDIGVDKSGFIFPEGFIQGQNLELALKRFAMPVISVDNFDLLPIPFRAVATDIVNGKAVILDSGDLAGAMRASMSAPGIFKPVRRDGRILVDGGLANNLPVQVVQDLGAEILIVVDVGFPLLPEEQLDSALGVTKQMLTILINARAQDQIALMSSSDILISPDLGDFGSQDFQRISEAERIGREKAVELSAQLSRLSVTKEEYATYRSKLEHRQHPVPRIDNVVVENESWLSPKVIAARLSAQEGEQLDIDRLESDISNIYGFDTFETVTYDVITDAGENTLVVRATEKSWGPNYLRFGINLEDDFDGNSSYNVAARITRTEVNKLGGEIRAEVQIGESPRIFAEFYQPLDYASRWFVNPQIEFLRSSSGIFDTGGLQLAELGSETSRLTIDVGRQFGNWGEFRTGYSYLEARGELRIGPPGLDIETFKVAGITTSFVYDTIDRISVPRAGMQAAARWVASREQLGADAGFDLLSFSVLKPITWGSNTILSWWDFETTVNDTSSELAPFSLGGLFSLSGYAPGELEGKYAGMGRLLYYRRFGGQALSALSTPIYFGGSIEIGNVWQDRDSIGFGNTLFAGSVFMVLDSVLGPLYIAYGAAEGGRRSAYLFLGQTF